MSNRDKTFRRSSSRKGSRQKNSGEGPPRLDATNLTGITSLMNVQHLRTEIDLDESEKALMGRARSKSHKKGRELDPIKIYTKELEDLANDLGIAFLNDDAESVVSDALSKPTSQSLSTNKKTRAPPPKQFARPPRDVLQKDSIDDLIGDLDLGEDSVHETFSDRDDASIASQEDGATNSSFHGASRYDDVPSNDGGDDDSSNYDSGSGSDSDSEDYDSDHSDVHRRLGNGVGIDFGRARRHAQRHQKLHPVSTSGKHVRLARLTEEQERRQHINSVMSDMRRETRTSFGVERERVQDIKASKLEQIGQLKLTLEEEGIACTAVGNPNMNSPIEEIDSVLNILKLKNDRNRYSSLAEEVILGMAEGVETVFDGTRAIPLFGWKPDYTGYHNTVNVKLHRMRYETSRVVGNIIQKYNIGPTTRIIMELLPSFFLYPRQQKKQKGSLGLHAEYLNGGNAQVPQVGDARGAYSAIRRYDTPNSLNMLADI